MKKLIKWPLVLVAGLLLFYSCQKEELLTPVETMVDLPSADVLRQIAATAELPFDVSEEEVAEIGSRSEFSLIEYLEFKPEFSILLSAINRLPGLAILMDNPLLQITLLAPDNSAFNTYLTSSGYASIEEVPLNELNQLVSYHLLLGRKNVQSLKVYNSTMAYADSPSGGQLDLYAAVSDPRNATLNGTSKIANGNLFVGRTLVHRIDAVLTIPLVADFLTLDPQFSMFSEALIQTGLATDYLSVFLQDGPFTVFAPTNAAFQALLDSNPAWNNISDIPTATLEKTLRYHIVPGRSIPLHYLSAGMTISTMNTEATVNANTLSLTSSVINRTIRLTGNSNYATILSTIRGEIQSDNGVIHAIDTVLLP